MMSLLRKNSKIHPSSSHEEELPEEKSNIIVQQNSLQVKMHILHRFLYSEVSLSYHLVFQYFQRAESCSSEETMKSALGEVN